MALLERMDKEIKFGYLRDKPDPRDHKLATEFYLCTYPANYDPTGLWLANSLSNKWQAPYDQGAQGSCTANMGAGLVDFNQKQVKYPWSYEASRSFIYYCTRTEEGSDTNDDTGATIRGTIKAINKYGCCPEHGDPRWSMEYNDKDWKTAPSGASCKDALLHCALEYQSVPQNEVAVKSLLCQDIPIGFGFMVYSSFMTKKVQQSGVMPQPGWLEQIQGGHAVIAIGYLTNYVAGDQKIKDWVIVRNSWGENWGKKGTFLMPMKYFLNASTSSDFWAITKIGFAHKEVDPNKLAYVPNTYVHNTCVGVSAYDVMIDPVEQALDFVRGLSPHSLAMLGFDYTPLNKVTPEQAMAVARAVCAVMVPVCKGLGE